MSGPRHRAVDGPVNPDARRGRARRDSGAAPIRVVIADDHPIVLRGIEAVLAAERDFQVVAQCSDGEQTLAAVAAHDPDILVLDLRMPGRDGLEVLRELKARRARTRAVLLVRQLSDGELLEATRQQVAGVVLKEMEPRLLIQCLRKVHAGELWIERTTAARVFSGFLRTEARTQELGRRLRRREIEVVEKVARGLRNRAIAESLSISEATVKSHLHAVYQKLGVRSRAELIAYYNARRIR